jgi:hypothetical protein
VAEIEQKEGVPGDAWLDLEGNLWVWTGG